MINKENSINIIKVKSYFDIDSGTTIEKRSKASFEINEDVIDIFMSYLKFLNDNITPDPKIRITFIVESPNAEINKNIYNKIINNKELVPLYGNISDYIFNINKENNSNYRKPNYEDMIHGSDLI